MAVLSVENPTLLDLANMTDAAGNILAVIDILKQENEILEDMTFVEGNLPTGHTSSVETGIPVPTWRKLYGTVAPTKGTRVKITDTCGMLEAYSEADVDLVKLAKDPKQFRLQEDKSHIRGMNNEMTETLTYRNEGTEPEAFTGIAPLFNNLSAENADNILDATGTGTDNASIYLVVWSGDTVFGITPQNSKAGLTVTDKGQVTLQKSTGYMEAFQTHYKWDTGLVVADWRYIVRICNIDKSALTREYTSGKFTTGAHLPDLMFQAMRRIPNLSAGRAAFYGSRDIATWIGRQTSAAIQSSTLTSEMVGGRFIERFMGIPVRRVDAMAADESRVT